MIGKEAVMANINQMIADLDQQIGSLQTARDALASAHGLGPVLQTGPRTLTTLKRAQGVNVKRTMSPDARARIADAQKKRWALVNKAKAAPKKIATAKKGVVTKKVAAPRRPKAKKVPTTNVAVVETQVAKELQEVEVSE